jgi:hypothetical protein
MNVFSDIYIVSLQKPVALRSAAAQRHAVMLKVTEFLCSTIWPFVYMASRAADDPFLLALPILFPCPI